MSSKTFPPEKLIIPHDDHHGRLVGKTSSGDQFFITTPFTWGPEGGREFVALYIFDTQGGLIRTEIDDLGTRADLVGEEKAGSLPGNLAPANDRSEAIIEKHLESLGEISYEDIEVKLFKVERYGIEFGLIPQVEEDLEEDEEPVYVELQPGDYMAFMEPWDGEYDT